ncbi:MULTISPECIES: hypothetical protein [Streptomyces]|uniref:hypothetical protein n=1 Tax=Streptomyces TaxID=1883 RepID=UPI001CC24114|nr:hypothetical protein [Streptomyces venezuelae]
MEKKHLTSSILLRVRTDQPRQTGMDHWKGPHSGIISATPGLEEYRQIHLAEHNPGRWPATDGVQTSIPADRKIDGASEVTFRSALAPLKGRKQTKLAHADEINVFRRTLSTAAAVITPRITDAALECGALPAARRARPTGSRIIASASAERSLLEALRELAPAASGELCSVGPGGGS